MNVTILTKVILCIGLYLFTIHYFKKSNSSDNPFTPENTKFLSTRLM
ncbi:MAG: hypothetical protein GX639_11360 [Fibrobacter sp.]|nr:hypothetical protein [Fibrobacter sp.]